jgi:fluoride exporter
VKDTEPAVAPGAGAPPARERQPWVRGQAAVLGVVAVGGVAGACLRYGAFVAWPTPAAGFPTTTFVINTVGCAAMGVLMAVLTAASAPHPLARPFLGTGVLGGFTTFSAYALDGERLLDHGHPVTAIAYLVLTVVAALTAVTFGTATTRLVLPRLVAAVRESR